MKPDKQPGGATRKARPPAGLHRCKELLRPGPVRKELPRKDDAPPSSMPYPHNRGDRGQDAGVGTCHRHGPGVADATRTNPAAAVGSPPGAHHVTERPAPSRPGEPALVSIIIPSYNRARLLIDALESIARASWRPLEVVVADDGSSDDTRQVVGDFASQHPDLRVQFLERPHEGANSARNAGFTASTGAFVFFLDSDDLIEPDAITTLMEVLDDPAIPYCVAQMVETDLSGTQRYAEGFASSKLSYEGVVGSRWATIVALYRRDLLDRLGAFDASLEWGEDKEFLWRIVAGAGAPGKVIDDVVALRRNHHWGQLTDDFSPSFMGRHTIAALDAFVAWALRTERMTPAIARAAYPKLWIATARVGAAGERAWVERAITLADTLEEYAPGGANHAMKTAIAAMPRVGFSAIFAAMNLARRALHAVRNTRRRLAR